MQFKFSCLWTTVPPPAVEIFLPLGHEVRREEKRQLVILLLFNSCLNKLLAHLEAALSVSPMVCVQTTKFLHPNLSLLSISITCLFYFM